MPRNGSGTYAPPVNTWNPPVNGILATASDWTALLVDLTAALTQSVSKDGQTPLTAALNAGANKITNIANGTASTDAAAFGQIPGPTSGFLSVSGTNTITANASPAISAYENGQRFHFICANTNTSVVTINIDGVGAKTITKLSATMSIGPGDLIAGSVYEIVYYSGTGVFILLNANTDHPGTLVPSLNSGSTNGYAQCYGQAISRTDYATLFSVIGTTYGSGDGATTFNLPDLRGRGLFGKDDMGGSGASRITSGVSGITGTTLGAVGGDQRLHSHTHTGTTGSESANHTHSLAGGNPVLSGGADDLIIGGGGTLSQIYGSPVTGIQSANHTHAFTTDSSGAGSSQNMPPTMICLWMIKT